MAVLAVKMVLGYLLTCWWIRGRWRKEQNQEQLLEYLTGSWVDIDAIYWDRKDRRRSRFEWKKKCKSSVWDLLSLRCLGANQWKYWRSHPMWGLRGSLDMLAEWNGQHTAIPVIQSNENTETKETPLIKSRHSHQWNVTWSLKMMVERHYVDIIYLQIADLQAILTFPLSIFSKFFFIEQILFL